MAKKEKFGKFVLLERIDSSGLGNEYRSAKLGATGFEKIVSVLRLGPAISSHSDVAKAIMDQAKIAAQLQNPNVGKIFGIGKVESSFYISYEFIEGKSLKAIFARCHNDGFPFSVDHALLIASKICSALEYAHGRKSEAGGRYFHGLLTPGVVVVSYEGEVRVRGFGYWPGRVREAGLPEEESLCLAPEQAAGGAGDTRSDIFAVGAVLFQTLTGHALFEAGRTPGIPERVAQARLQSPSGDDDSLPRPIADILNRALALDPAGRYAEIQEMRKAIDTLLFSGDFTPTTFNLAFFMHSLFREDIERESKTLKEDKEASYQEYLEEAPKAPAPKPAPAAAGATVILPAASHAPAPRPEPLKALTSREEPRAPDAFHETLPGVHAPAHAPSHAPAHAAEPPPGLSPKEAAASFTFHRDEPKSKTPLLAGAAILVLLGGGGAAAYFLLGRGATAPLPPSTAAASQAPPTLTAEAQAAMQRVQELEDKLKKLEEEKTAAAAKAEEQAKKKLEEQAKAKGENVDPAALAKAQEEARKKAQAEQEKKAVEEKRRLEEEKKAEEARIAEEQRKAEEARKVAEAAAAAAASQPTAPPPTTAPALKPGTLVNLSDLGVISPVAESTPALQYPPIALRQRLDGTVELNVLVDEHGVVTDAQVVTAAGGKSGLNEAAVENVKKRKYRAATKDGVPVKVWIPVKVRFELPK